VAFFQLSGGSTGTPKLIPRTHNDYDYSIRRSNELCGVSAETRYLNALPAAHNYAMSSPGSLGVFLAGGVVVLAHDPSATLCFPLIEKHQINLTSLVPPAVSLWLQAIHDGAAMRSCNRCGCCRWAARACRRPSPRAFRRKSAASCSRSSAWRRGW
jgi:2,3-dihydroxybenzoate-AMP ligase